MFNSLKEKLKNWTKKISEKTETIEDTKKSKEKIKADKASKEEVKNIPIPTKFEPGLQTYVPDMDKIKEIEEDLDKTEKIKPGEKGFFKKVTEKLK
ncbi:hypothetical protein IID10_11780, partial [candidate division KSB1 bacterium]|nr:hypothetical protein [candidate division KSB1 bacterium]